ncbi:MAG: DUF2029 domain-containing protein [Lachnospiraceae bacterium]|nr:DUF2029 domain-containing protein [Lachnospiraceae bacterium]
MDKTKTVSVKAPKQCIFRKLAIPDLKWYDWVILAALMGFLFLAYQMHDLAHTAGCSYGYLNGHILDFYDYLAANGIAEDGEPGLWASYLPTIYLIFAVWNLPMKLFGIVTEPTSLLGFVPLMWAKILPCLVYLAGGFVVYRIAMELGMGDRKSRFTAFAYLSMPVALFSQFGLGQYESFIVLFVLLGVWKWLQKKDLWFVVFFAVAFTFKYTVLIYFFPLLFLREKNIWKIILKTAGFLSLFLLEYLIYRGSPAFSAHVFGIGSEAASNNTVNSLWSVSYFTGNELLHVRYNVYVVVIVFALVAAFAYFKKTRDEGETQRYAMWLMLIAFAGLFAFTKWYAHYLMLAVPFWVITAMMSKHTKIWFVLDLLFMLFFSMYNVQFFAYHHDEYLLRMGIFQYVMPDRIPGNSFNMSEILGILEPSLTLTMLTALIVVYAVFKHPSFMREDLSEFPEKTAGWMRARTVLGLLIFIIPSMIALFTTIKPLAASYREDYWAGSTVSLKEQTVSQEFTASSGSVSRLKFRLIANLENENVTVRVAISEDPEGEKALYEKTLASKDYYDGERIILKPSVSLETGRKYYVVFSSEGQEDPGAAVLMTSDRENGCADLLVNGSPETGHVVMDVLN